jgi:hypothetical protein
MPAVEAVEDPRCFFGVEAGALVGNGDHRAISPGSHLDVHRRRRRGVHCGIAEEVVEDLAQASGVSVDHDRVAGVEADEPFRLHCTGVLDGLDRHTAHIDRLMLERTALVQASEQE